MNSTTIITIAIAVLAVLGLGVVLTATRRSDIKGVGSLSRETRKRDRDSAKIARNTSRDAEYQGVASRSAVAVMPPAAVETWVAPDADALGETRRAFLNRATVTLMSASLGGFAAALIAFLWKGAEGGFGSKINAGKVDDVIGQILRVASCICQRRVHGLLNIQKKRSRKPKLLTVVKVRFFRG